MLILKYLLTAASILIFGTAAGLVGYDVWLAYELQHLLRRKSEPASGLAVGEPLTGRPSRAPRALRWWLAGKLAAVALVSLLAGESMAFVPDGSAGVRVSQISGVRPGTLYPGVHMVVPYVESIATYDLHDQIYATSATQELGPHKKDVLTVSAREGLPLGLAVAVRYRLDAQRLSFIHSNVPQPIEQEVIAPVVSSIFREVAASYVVRDVFTVHREDFHSKAAKAITERLAADGIFVKEVVLRDVRLPAEYAKGLESLLLKEQESERLNFETDIKQKEVRIAELEGEAQKARDIKQAEAQAQVHVLQAKSESDAMQYTLPLKQKQIEQSRLEAEARKEATIQNAQAAAESKVIDSKAEVERRRLLADAEANAIRVRASAESETKVIDSKAEAERRRLLAEADANTIRLTAAADSERMNLEAVALKANPLLIQKMIAERLSDKLQIIMVPMDGSNFFAGDVLRSAFSGQGTSIAPNGPAAPPRRGGSQQ
jgi:regulator of protease activity HflC (stomatin/prohibitin superfamily)